MLKPQKSKFKKIQNNKKKKIFSYQSCMSINFSIQKNIFFFSKEFGFLSSKQLEIGRRLIQKMLDKLGSVSLCTFPHKPISRKPTGVRIGKGKGSSSFWVSKVSFGQNVYEIKVVKNFNSINKLKDALSKKLPIKIGIKEISKNQTWL